MTLKTLLCGTCDTLEPFVEDADGLYCINCGGRR